MRVYNWEICFADFSAEKTAPGQMSDFEKEVKDYRLSPQRKKLGIVHFPSLRTGG